MGFSIGRQALSRGELFSAYVAFGVSLLFSGQALINIGVNIGLLPTKGLTLPFLSYGGASLIVCCYMAPFCSEYNMRMTMHRLLTAGFR